MVVAKSSAEGALKVRGVNMEKPFAMSVMTDVRPEEPGEASRRYRELLEEAVTADSLGYRALMTSEQHCVDDGSLGAQFPLLAGAAAVTRSLKMMTCALLLPLYVLRQVVEEAIVVDLISAGRLELGLAAGAYRREYSAFGRRYSERGRSMEELVPLLRLGLEQGILPDGLGGEALPVSPRPVQHRVPLLLGGMSTRAVDRAARLGDGHIAYDYEHPEIVLPRHWSRVVVPALERHGVERARFRFVAIVHLWVGEDPERDWEEVVRPAFEYQQRRYLEMSDGAVPDGLGLGIPREHLLVGTPEDVAERLIHTWRSAPWDELAFWYRLRGIPHLRAVEHLDTVASRLIPLLRAKTDHDHGGLK
jgi:alkanesulfonate monooxygenase SsuD/methylene tetrahydromethanopterin reductase-like flavin-dependent oxidoreductase (luciferase family)